MLKKINKISSILYTIGGIIAICIIVSKFFGFNVLTWSSAYVTAVKEGKLDSFPQITLGEAFDKSFTSPIWKHKEIAGTHYVTFSGVSKSKKLVEIKFRITDDQKHFLYEEGKVNGQSNEDTLLSIMEGAFPAEVAPATSLPASTANKEVAQPTPASPVNTKNSENLRVDAPSQTKESSIVSLKNFLIWGQTDQDKQLSVKLDGEKASIIVGNDHPNGIKLQVIDSLKQAWQLQLPIATAGDTPFSEYGDLKKGFNIYLKDFDFDNDGTPEIVVAASNQVDQSYVWVLSYNFVASENGTSPLELIWSGEGQSDVQLENNNITLPFGSQGLSDTYVYSNGTFKKQ